MISITVDKTQTDRLATALGDKAKRLPNEIATAINATARKVKSEISKIVRQELATSAKAVNATLSQPRRATKSQLGATIRLAKTKRIPLRDFGARQTRKGVSYRISKTRGRKSIAGAFLSTRLGGHAFKRKGKSRLPIDKLHGVSPWGVFSKSNRQAVVEKMAQAELEKQIERRIRFRTLQATGEL